MASDAGLVLQGKGDAGPILSDQTSLFGDANVVGFRRGPLSVREIPRQTAVDLIVANHYSHKVYAASTLHLGVFWGDDLRGALQYGFAMNPVSQGSVVADTLPNEYLELNRLWIDDDMPRNAESSAISLSLKTVRAMRPDVAWVQSFADERCGRFGVTYQACSFLYCGEHTATFWLLDGEWYHNSLMTRDPSLTPIAAYIQANKERAVSSPFRQFRYVKFLRPAFRKRLLLPVLSYPKHAGDVEETSPTTSREVAVQCRLPALAG